jgi:hypothetical protein
VGYPPVGDLILIDGRMTDWDSKASVVWMTADGTDDGYDKSGNPAPGLLGASADIRNVWCVNDIRSTICGWKRWVKSMPARRITTSSWTWITTRDPDMWPAG